MASLFGSGKSTSMIIKESADSDQSSSELAAVVYTGDRLNRNSPD